MHTYKLHWHISLNSEYYHIVQYNKDIIWYAIVITGTNVVVASQSYLQCTEYYCYIYQLLEKVLLKYPVFFS